MKNMTRHAQIRSHQRGLPPLILDLLKRSGRRTFDHHGAVQPSFDNKARPRVAHEVGRTAVARLHECWNAFAVLDTASGSVLTCGHQYQKIHQS